MFGLAETIWQTRNVEGKEASPPTSYGGRVGALLIGFSGRSSSESARLTACCLTKPSEDTLSIYISLALADQRWIVLQKFDFSQLARLEKKELFIAIEERP